MKNENGLHIDWKPEDDEIYLSGTVRNLSDNIGAEAYQVKAYNDKTITPAKNLFEDLKEEFITHYMPEPPVTDAQKVQFKQITKKACKMAKVWIGVRAGYSFREIGRIIRQSECHAHRLFIKTLEIKKGNVTV